MPTPISSPGASCDSSVRLRAPIAWVTSFEPLVERWTAASRSTGSATSVPRLTTIADTWLPRSDRSASVRTDTGVIARIDASGQLAVLLEVRAQRAADDGQRDVVDGGAGDGVAHRSQRGERERAGRRGRGAA